MSFLLLKEDVHGNESIVGLNSWYNNLSAGNDATKIDVDTATNMAATLVKSVIIMVVYFSFFAILPSTALWAVFPRRSLLQRKDVGVDIEEYVVDVDINTQKEGA